MKETSLQGKTRDQVLLELAQSVSDKAALQLISTNFVVSSDGPRWRIGVDFLNAGLDDIFSEQTPLKVFEGPSLLISGGTSHHTSLLPATAGTMEEIYSKFVKDFRNVTISGAGHMVHMEKPKETREVIKNFLEA